MTTKSESNDRVGVLCFGYNGVNNTGSEAKLLVTLADLRAALGDRLGRIGVVTRDARNQRRYLPDRKIELIELGSLRQPADFEPLRARYDLLVLSEGSTFIDHFGSGWFHLHTLGLHLLPHVAQLKNLAAIEISDDPNVPERGFLILDRIKKTVGDVPVQVAARPGEFIEGLERGTLPGNVIYLVCEDNYADVPDMTVDDANRLMEKVRAYRAPEPA